MCPIHERILQRVTKFSAEFSFLKSGSKSESFLSPIVLNNYDSLYLLKRHLNILNSFHLLFFIIKGFNETEILPLLIPNVLNSFNCT